MKKHFVLLTRNQWLGVAILLLLLSMAFVGLHFLPEPKPQIPQSDTLEQKIHSSKKLYYDSLRIARTARYDSLRLVRRDSLYRVYTAHRDSMRAVDSVWWDSVYSARPTHVKKDTLIELNSADTLDLVKIRGIGSSMARRIVHYREQLGGYTGTQQLLDNGLYMDKYGHSMRSRYCLNDSILVNFTVCMDSVKTISVNHASVERLQSHPYISHTLAKEIYTYRRQHVHLHAMEELLQLPHMNDSLYQKLAPYLNFDIYLDK